jgi:hypothetical protein
VIDPAHTTVGFAVRHLMSRVRGTFSEVSGQIITGPHPSRSAVTAAIGVSSVSTGNPMRDDHLRSADFFDAGHYPVMTFTSTAVRPAGGCYWVLAGRVLGREDPLRVRSGEDAAAGLVAGAPGRAGRGRRAGGRADIADRGVAR